MRPTALHEFVRDPFPELRALEPARRAEAVGKRRLGHLVLDLSTAAHSALRRAGWAMGYRAESARWREPPPRRQMDRSSMHPVPSGDSVGAVVSRTKQPGTEAANQYRFTCANRDARALNSSVATDV